MKPTNAAASESSDVTERLFRIALWAFVGAIGFSIAGTLLLKLAPSLMQVFGPYYPTLVKAPTWTYMTLLPLLSVLMYSRSLGWPLLTFFVIWGSVVGGLSELIGTTTGFPFGAYTYTAWLGPRLLGHVPYFIPASWFAMSIISLDLARRIARHRWERILLAALFMTLWDVSLDPAMSRAFPFWTYPGGGFFFGMPASNWAGWLGVSLVIVAGYEFIGGGLRASHRWAPGVYVLNCVFPLSISLLYGLYAAFAIGAAATALPVWLLWRRDVFEDVGESELSESGR
jgi:putative membrane protein